MRVELIKSIHLACVATTFILFVARGLLMMRDVPWRQIRLLRIAPHVVDTLLLASAIGLAFATRQYPFVAPWLTAKLLALLAYIVAGTVALSGRPTVKNTRITAWLIALLIFAYIVGVALTRNPMPFN